MKKNVISGILALTMTMSLFAGCGGDSKSSSEVSNAAGSSVASDDTATGASKYKDFITVDVYDSQANYQGIQSGWFGKIVKDKFNMELNLISPNVAGGGDTLFQTRSAAGNLGDLIFNTSAGGKLQDLVTAGLVTDMTDLIKDKENLNKYKAAIEYQNKKLVKESGTWAIPSEVSELPATTSLEGTDPNFGTYIRWDLYKQLGYPEMNTMEDLLPVMEDMQALDVKSDTGKKVYAFSLFKDWDGELMSAAANMMSYYGYSNSGFAMGKADDSSDPVSVIDDKGIYIRALKFYFNANQMGLVDPESTTQNYDTLGKKYEDGAVLFTPWPWLGKTKYNTTKHTSEGKGFMMAPIKDETLYSWGCYSKGNPNQTIMLGSQAQDPERMADFIDWLYSPEGVLTQYITGPEGLTWEMKDGAPQLTEFGKKCFVDQEATMPDEYGGGTWKDGISQLTYKTISNVEINPNTKFPYNYTLWDSYLKLIETDVERDWKEKTGVNTTFEYLTKNNQVIVSPGSGFASPAEDSDITTIRSQCKATIVEYSWKSIFAKDEAEFNSLIKKMKDTVNGLGYENVLEVDLKNLADKKQASIDVMK